MELFPVIVSLVNINCRHNLTSFPDFDDTVAILIHTLLVVNANFILSFHLPEISTVRRQKTSASEIMLFPAD